MQHAKPREKQTKAVAKHVNMQMAMPGSGASVNVIDSKTTEQLTKNSNVVWAKLIPSLLLMVPKTSYHR